MMISIVGTLFLLSGHVLNFVIPSCVEKSGDIDFTKPSSEWVDPVKPQSCSIGVLPIILGSVGTSVYFVVLTSSIAYFAIPPVLGLGFGLAFSTVNSVKVLFDLLFDQVFDMQALDVS